MYYAFASIYANQMRKICLSAYQRCDVAKSMWCKRMLLDSTASNVFNKCIPDSPGITKAWTTSSCHNASIKVLGVAVRWWEQSSKCGIAKNLFAPKRYSGGQNGKQNRLLVHRTQNAANLFERNVLVNSFSRKFYNTCEESGFVIHGTYVLIDSLILYWNQFPTHTPSQNLHNLEYIKFRQYKKLFQNAIQSGIHKSSLRIIALAHCYTVRNA